MTAAANPTPDGVKAFLSELRSQHERLSALAQTGAANGELAAAIDEVGEQLLVADEELRVQADQLAQSSHRLDLLVAAYEQLFADAPVAYLQTNASGLIVRMNRAAVRLLGAKHPEQTRTLAGLLRPADRPLLRYTLTRLRAGADRARLGKGPPEILEAAILRPDGIEVPVVLAVRPSRAGITDAPTLHWEVREQSAAGPASTHIPIQVERAAPLAQQMADATVDVDRQDDPARALQHLVERTRDTIPGCDEVGVTLVRSRGRFETPAATGDLAAGCDRLQYQLHEGPCLEAVDDSTPIRVPDMALDRRWPRFAPRAAALGVGSMLALPLITARGTLGALNLYARGGDAFDDDDTLIGQALGTHAGIVLAHMEMEANLRDGLQTREEIGRAVGILMERHRVPARAAFEMLVVASQKSHRKLRDIAAWMNETGEDPTTLVP